MPKRSPDPAIDALQDRLGHRFADPVLLRRALTHSSVEAEANNERLEFLGDRVLNLVVAEELFRRYPAEKEGDLARRHAALVQAATLTRTAIALRLDDCLAMSEAEAAAGGRANANMLADAVEATLGALFLDAGLEACRRAVLDVLADDFATMTAPPRDAKTALQEWAQARGLPLPVYTLVERTGPDHAPVFTVEVRIDGHDPARRAGPSRRQAEKDAAAVLLAAVESG